ncbi:putative methyltransferase [Hyphodiscus hymeniophilus]|uniref:Methyltransferase n=1 Tax=Hyphodiscus hymeniophilus TaxID=353542 RepID=A0A9P6VPI4_9HELO|nr:putative methyltransferase [Hyphodiscus hymeniophilus]
MVDWAEKNRDHFNNSASTYNSKFSKTILQIIEEIQVRRDWIGIDWIDEEDESNSLNNVRLLDYACGTGLVSRALAPYITSATGIDISSSMVHEYNTSASNQGIPESEMHAVVGNLIDSSSLPDSSFEGKEFFDFDVAAVGMGWHHFTDPAYAAKALGKRLKKGGVLLIIDFLPHEGIGEGGHGHGHAHHHGHSGNHNHNHSHDAGDQGEKERADGYGEDKNMESAAAHTVTHWGFAKEDIKKMYEEAGVGVDFDFVVLGKGVVFEKEGKSMRRTAFMAKGRKA